MFVGVLRAVLQIPASRSLKDRRRVVRSAKERLRARQPVSVAEVGDVELLQRATLGIAVVARESSVCEETLTACRNMLSTLRDAVLADTRSEIVSFGSAGSELRDGLGERFAAMDEPWEDDDE